MRKAWTPSIVPAGNIYLVMGDLGRLGRVWREADAEHTDLETVIRELVEGQYKIPVGVFGFNPFEGWSRDVSEDVAQEIRRRCDLQAQDVPSTLQDGASQINYLSQKADLVLERCVCAVSANRLPRSARLPDGRCFNMGTMSV